MKTAQLASRCLPLLLALLPATSQAQPFTLSADGSEVTDQATGLIWRHCAEGLSGSKCELSTALTFTHEAALQRAVTESNRTATAWRLPNVKELSSIVDITLSPPNPAIDANFPATPTDKYFWSSSPYVANPANAWSVYFVNGHVGLNSRSNSYYVRLVRAGQ